VFIGIITGAFGRFMEVSTENFLCGQLNNTLQT
jgi:hypothetical protein